MRRAKYHSEDRVRGIEEKNIDVRIENNTLTVHGERNSRRKRKRRTIAGWSGVWQLHGSFKLPSMVKRRTFRQLRQGCVEDQAGQEGGSQAKKIKVNVGSEKGEKTLEAKGKAA